MKDNQSILRTFVIKMDVPIVFITNAEKEFVLNNLSTYCEGTDETWAWDSAQNIEEKGYICKYYIGEMI